MEIDLNRFSKKIIFFSYLYLLIPYMVFGWGWLNVPFGLLTTCLIFISLMYVIKYEKENSQVAAPINVNAVRLIFLIALIALWVGLSGVGGMNTQTDDYHKTNAILRDLIIFDWPVVYTNGSTLVYYIAYHLPVAMVGKLLGFEWAAKLMFLWAFSGMFLVFSLMAILFEKFDLKLVVFFVLFSGLDLLGRLFFPDNPMSRSIGFYFSYGSYQSNAGQLFWVPFQAIPIWLIMGLVMLDFKRKNPYNIFFVSSLATLWSPVGMVGLAPFVVSTVVTYRKKLSKFVNLLNVAGGGIFLLCFAYLSTGYLSSQEKIAGPIWHFIDFKKNALWLLIFLMLEFGLYLLCADFKKLWKLKFIENHVSKALFMATIVSLLCIPLYKMGNANDFMMRGSIPALFSLQIFIFSRLTQDEASFFYFPFRKKILVSLLFVGFLTPIVEMWQWSKFPARIKDDYVTLDNYQSSLLRDLPLDQYMGSGDSFFSKYISRKNFDLMSRFKFVNSQLEKNSWKVLNWRRPHPDITLLAPNDDNSVGFYGENVCSGLGRSFHFKKNQVYKISAIARGEDVHPNPDPGIGGFGAALSIEGPGFVGVEFPKGDFDWTEKFFYFRAYQDEDRNLLLSLGQFGTGWGKVWFKNVRIEELKPVRKGMLS